MEPAQFIKAAVNGQKAVVEEHAYKMPIAVIKKAYDKMMLVNSRDDEDGDYNEIIDILESIIDDVENDSDDD